MQFSRILDLWQTLSVWNELTGALAEPASPLTAMLEGTSKNAPSQPWANRIR